MLKTLNEYHHYLIDPESQVGKAIAEAREQRKQAFDKGQEFAKSIGADSALYLASRGSNWISWFFAKPDAEIPKGLKVLPKESQMQRCRDTPPEDLVAWIPNRRFKVGKEFEMRMRSAEVTMPCVSASAVNASSFPYRDRFQPSGSGDGRGYLLTNTVVSIGDDDLYLLPVDKDEFSPPSAEGLTYLKGSKVVQMLEERNEAKEQSND